MTLTDCSECAEQKVRCNTRNLSARIKYKYWISNSCSDIVQTLYMKRCKWCVLLFMIIPIGTWTWCVLCWSLVCYSISRPYLRWGRRACVVCRVPRVRHKSSCQINRERCVRGHGSMVNCLASYHRFTFNNNGNREIACRKNSNDMEQDSDIGRARRWVLAGTAHHSNHRNK